MKRISLFMLCSIGVLCVLGGYAVSGCHAPTKLFDRAAAMTHPLYLPGPWPADSLCNRPDSACEWRFADNMTGPGGMAVWAWQVGCDVDHDGDADLADVATFQECGPQYWSGPFWQLWYVREDRK